MGINVPKKILRILIFALFVIFQLYFIFFKSFSIQDYHDYVNEFPLPLFGETKKIAQEFRTPGVLAEIDIMLANYLKIPESGFIRLSIFKQAKRLFLKNFPANQAEDNRFYSFPIEGVKIPKGDYRLQLEFFRENSEDKLAAWITKRNIYPQGNLYLNGNLHEGDLTFRVYYHSTIWNARDKLLQSKPQITIRSLLLISALLALILMLNILVFYLLKGDFVVNLCSNVNKTGNH